MDFKKLSKEMSGSSGILGSLLLFLVLALLIILILWANWTELDNVTRGEGKIVSSIENQIVQASEEGVIKSRFVEEGEIVNTNTLLFEIDPIEAKTSYEQALQRLSSLKIQEIRLSAEVLGNEPIFPEDLITKSSTVVVGEKALFAARRADLNAQLAVLNQQMIQREQQIDEIQVGIKTSNETLELLNKQINIIKPLVETGLSPEMELLGLLRQAKDFEGKEESFRVSLLRAKTSIIEVEQEINSVRQSYRTSSQSELSKIISEIAEIESKIPALEDRVIRTQVKSPVKGIINRINFTTLGGFVRPGDALLEIVPTGDDLIVEAKIDPKDIAYIEPRQKARISLTAYDASRYGTIDGEVIKVSPDAVEDKASGLSFYIVDVSIDSELQEDDGSVVEILPGMVASVDVLAGKRTVLDYIWNPMLKIKERALTD
ncbi:MAG: HlyD family type I secretion periplasmic adaptor subunit [Paracoccaceae bacterium]